MHGLGLRALPSAEGIVNVPSCAGSSFYSCTNLPSRNQSGFYVFHGAELHLHEKVLEENV